MSVEVQNSQTQEQKSNDKEYNFRQLEAKYERIVAAERAEKEKITRELEEERKKAQKDIPEEEDDDEPFVDHKHLHRKLTSFEKKLEEKIEKKAEEKARNLFESEKRESWVRANPDFYEVLQHAEKLAKNNPELAENILQMPDTFERQRLVYSNIKALGLNKPPSQEQSIQEKIESNRKSPYYQPSGIGTAPYSTAGDFSPSGQKNAYDKMKELQRRLKLG